MGTYHNRLNKRSFKNAVYIIKFEDATGIKISKEPLQYELIFETHNTNLDVNNIIYSKKYIPIKDKVDKMILVIDTYVNKYQNKIYKCKDLTCIELFHTLVGYSNELKEMKELERVRIEKGEKGTKLNIKSIGSRVSTYITLLDMIGFDKLYDCKGMTYARQVNERIPKKYACKLYTDEEIQDSLIFNNNKLEVMNNAFFCKYLDKTGIDLNKDIKQRNFIIDIHKNIEALDNAFVDYYTYKDETTLNITKSKLSIFLKTNISFIQDISYTTLFKKLNVIFEDMVNNNIDNAFEKIKHIIVNDDMNLYERVS